MSKPTESGIGAVVVLACILCLTAAVGAGPLNQGTSAIPYRDLFPGAEFAADIPTPPGAADTGAVGRPLGTDEIVAYFRILADNSARARLFEYARSHEGRPLVYLAVGEPEVIAGLEEFRTEHQDALDPRTRPADGSAAARPAVAWMAYGIHGDELSSSDAAVALAYWLTAGEDEGARSLRRGLVVLIDPCENPDGRARYLAQIAGFAHRRANPDQDDLSHAGVWPWGRGNHYLFDLNRDWFTQVHPESRRATEIARWLPQLVVDSHEMGANATYLFPPARHPFNPHLPGSARKWAEPFSDDQGRALDRRGYPYFTGEWNEEFFPGYGSSWARYLGAVGILYEMSRTTGTLVTKRDGTVRTFAQAVDHQVTSSVANLTTLAENAAEVLTDMLAAREEAVAAGRRGPIRAWVFPPDPRRPGRLPELAELLLSQGIEVQVLEAGRRQDDLHDAVDGRRRELDLPPGTLLVSLAQPQGPLARVILDPHVPMETGFFADERQYLEKGKGSRLYDTTSWSVPLARGLDAYWLDSLPSGSWDRWRRPQAAPPGILPERFHSVVVAGDTDTAPAVLARLLADGLSVRIARKAFTVADRSFAPGAIVLRREGNPADLGDRLRRIQQDLQVEMVPVGTARAAAGPDLGGAEYPVLVPPRVGVLSGSPVGTSAYGFIWHLLDQQVDLRFNSLDIGGFGRLDLSRYNVLVFPPVFGGTSVYRQILGDDGLARLREWVKAGGTAIGIGGGARLLASPQSELTRARFRGEILGEFPSPVWSLTAAEVERAGRPTATGLRVPPPAKEKDEQKAPAPARAGSLFDVAPVLGPGALPFCAGHDQGRPLGTDPIALDRWLEPVLPAGEAEVRPEDRARADRRLRAFMPQGAMLAVDLDPEFWLNFGLDPVITAWFGSDDTLIASPPVTVAGRFADLEHLHRSGLLWPEAAARIAETGYVTCEKVGRGQVILFADHPAYRRWMRDSERLLINAILLGPGLGTRWSSPW